MMSLYTETIIIKPMWSKVKLLDGKKWCFELFHIYKFGFRTHNLYEILWSNTNFHTENIFSKESLT